MLVILQIPGKFIQGNKDKMKKAVSFYNFLIIYLYLPVFHLVFMRPVVLFFIGCFLFQGVKAEKVKVRVVDAQEHPVSWATVFVPDLLFATCSNEEGYFTIETAQLSETSFFEVSHLTCMPCKLTWKEIREKGNRIFLTTKEVTLEEVVISPHRPDLKEGERVWRKFQQNLDKNQVVYPYLLDVHNLYMKKENGDWCYFHESEGQVLRLGYTAPLCQTLRQSYTAGNDFLHLQKVRETSSRQKGRYLYVDSGYPYYFLVQEYFSARKMQPKVLHFEEEEQAYYLEVSYVVTPEDKGIMRIWIRKEGFSLQSLETQVHFVVEQERKIDVLVREKWEYEKSGDGIYPASYSEEKTGYQSISKDEEYSYSSVQRVRFSAFRKALPEEVRSFFPGKEKELLRLVYDKLLSQKDYACWGETVYKEQDWKGRRIPAVSREDEQWMKRDFEKNFHRCWVEGPLH